MARYLMPLCWFYNKTIELEVLKYWQMGLTLQTQERNPLLHML
jgi:hypothetical protein